MHAIDNLHPKRDTFNLGIITQKMCISKWKLFLFGIKISLGKCVIYEQMDIIFICNKNITQEVCNLWANEDYFYLQWKYHSENV